MSKNKSIDNLIDEINNDIEKVNNSKDIRKNVILYNLNNKKIKMCKEILNEYENLLNNESNDSSSEDLITDAQYLEYLRFIEETKNNISNNTNLNESIKIYLDVIEKINKCKDYIENQKIEINNIN